MGWNAMPSTPPTSARLATALVVMIWWGAKLVFDGRTVGTVAITDHGAAGKVEIGGLQHIFAAEHATGKAGVYRLAATNADDAWDGWIVLNDGTYTGTSKSKPITGNPWIDPDTDP